MTTATSIEPSVIPVIPPAGVSVEALEILLHDLAEEAAEQRWSEKGEHAGELVLSATSALRNGLLENARNLAASAGRLLGNPLTLGFAA